MIAVSVTIGLKGQCGPKFLVDYKTHFALFFVQPFNPLVKTKTMEAVTNGCNGTHINDDDDNDVGRTDATKHVILSNSNLPHSENNVNNNNHVDAVSDSNGSNDNSSSIIKNGEKKRRKKCAAFLDDNRYAVRIEDMVEEHLKFGRCDDVLILCLCRGRGTRDTGIGYRLGVEKGRAAF